MNIESFPEIDFTALQSELKTETKPNWGTMTAHEMIEHLEVTYLLVLSNDNAPVFTPAEKLDKTKKLFFEPLGIFKENFQNPLLTGQLKVLRHASLSEAINSLQRTHNLFVRAINTKDFSAKTHPIFGALSNPEWLHFFKKHMRHHFTQFGLL